MRKNFRKEENMSQGKLDALEENILDKISENIEKGNFNDAYVLAQLFEMLYVEE
jgi:hypothetical protein